MDHQNIIVITARSIVFLGALVCLFVVSPAAPAAADEVNTEIRGDADTSSPDSFFTFWKNGPLFKKPEGMGSPGPYYPTLVDMDGVEDFPFDYALYFSTDHHTAEGGIWLYVCNGAPSDPKNWKSYDRAVADGDFD